MKWYSEKMMISLVYLHTWFHAQLAQKILNGIYHIGMYFMHFFGKRTVRRSKLTIDPKSLYQRE